MYLRYEKKKDSGEIYLNGTYSYLPEKKELYKNLTVQKKCLK